MMKQLLIAAMVIALGACASSGSETSVSDATAAAAQTAPAETTADEDTAARDDVVCRWETRPGSNFREKVCRSVAQIEARREEDQAAMRQMRSMRSGSQADVGN